ncbi:YiiX family permuted papain-like enzyme [soil metagenome]
MRIIPRTRADFIRLGVLFALLVAACVYSKAQVLLYRLAYRPHEGDIIFQSLPHGDLVDAIEGATHSPFSHVGVVLLDEQGKWVVIEAIGSVHETPLLQWMQRGRGAGVAIYRLKREYSSRLPEFKKYLLSFSGLPYDFDYEFSDRAIYCSELVFKAFRKTTGEEMGKTQQLGELDWKPHSEFIQSVQGGTLPLDRLMITPVSLSRAPQMELVRRMGM